MASSALVDGLQGKEQEEGSYKGLCIDPVDSGNVGMMDANAERYSYYVGAAEGKYANQILKRLGSGNSFVILSYSQLRCWYPEKFEKLKPPKGYPPENPSVE